MVSHISLFSRNNALKYATTLFSRNFGYEHSYMTPTYGAPYPYKTPFPYESKKFTMITEHFDYTLPRFNENTKVIVVEGNLAVGKHDFAKKLAKSYDLKLFPATDEGNCFRLDHNHFDVRNLNEFLPKRSQWYDLKAFLNDDHAENGRAGQLQQHWIYHKFKTYCNALTHLFNTGQGVVLVRSTFSDHVFTEALYKCGFITPEFYKWYHDLEANSLVELLKPHLTIYLDAPVDFVRERINERGNEDEINSKNLTDDYLQAVESAYKNIHFPKMGKSGVIMEVDWREILDDIDMDAIVEEIQTINLATEDSEDQRFRDWFDMSEDMASFNRRKFASDVTLRNGFTRDRPIQCPEILPHVDDNQLLNRVWKYHPALMYDPGEATQFGHSNWFKF